MANEQIETIPLADYHPREKTEDLEKRMKAMLTEYTEMALVAEDDHLDDFDETGRAAELLAELDRMEATLYFRHMMGLILDNK